MKRLILMTGIFAAAALAAAPASAGGEACRENASRDFADALTDTLPKVQSRLPELKAQAGNPSGKIFPAADRGRDWDRGRGHRRDVDCRGYDKGWEEHWGGHGGRGLTPGQACTECKARHGGCRFQCTAPAYRCKAEWTAEDGTRREYEGRPRDDRYDAEDDAVNRCRDDNWNNRQQGRCRPLDCKSEDEVVDSGRC